MARKNAAAVQFATETVEVPEVLDELSHQPPQEPVVQPGGLRIRNKGLKRVRVADIVDNEKNHRTHPNSQKKAFRGVVEEIGFYGYVDTFELPDGRLKLIDGELRKYDLIEAYGGDTEIEVNVTDFSEAEARKALLSKDHVSAMAEIDSERLAELMSSVEAETAGMQSLIDDMWDTYVDDGSEPAVEEVTDGDEPPTPSVPTVPVTVAGDVWICGEHRVYCGDSTKPEHVAKLMNGERTDSVLTDPPYGISWDGDYTRFTKGDVKTCSSQYSEIHGDSEPFNPTPWVAFKNVILWGANFYATSLPVGSWLIWDKRSSDGTSFLADAELAWQKGGKGCYIKSINQRAEASKLRGISHPTKKPVSLFVWCIERLGDGVIFDPFLGSGTTMLAAEQLSRRCFGMEISPPYCDVIATRWENVTGQSAILESTGQTFEEVKAARYVPQ